MLVHTKSSHSLLGMLCHISADVGPKVYRLFKKRLTDAQKASQLWQRLLHVEEGHDAHHHVRLVGVEDVAEQDALAALHPDNLPIVPTQRVGGPAETQPPAAK